VFFSLNIFSQKIDVKNIDNHNFLTKEKYKIEKKFTNKYEKFVDYSQDLTLFNVYYLQDSLKRNEQYYIYYFDKDDICFSYKFIFQFTPENVNNIIDYFDKKAIRQFVCSSESQFCWIQIIKNEMYYKILYYENTKNSTYCTLLSINKNDYDMYIFLLNEKINKKNKLKEKQNFL
jgi:hypothetical protein